MTFIDLIYLFFNYRKWFILHLYRSSSLHSSQVQPQSILCTDSWYVDDIAYNQFLRRLIQIKQYYIKILLNSFHLNGQTLEFHPQTLKLKPPFAA